MALTEGWIYIDDGGSYDMQLYCEDWELDIQTKPHIQQLPSNSRIGFDLGYITRTLTVYRVNLTSLANALLFIKNLRLLQASGTFEVKLKVDDSNFFAFDGDTDTTMQCFYVNLKGIKKIAHGAATHYQVDRVVFKEAG